MTEAVRADADHGIAACRADEPREVRCRRSMVWHEKDVGPERWQLTLGDRLDVACEQKRRSVRLHPEDEGSIVLPGIPPPGPQNLHAESLDDESRVDDRPRDDRSPALGLFEDLCEHPGVGAEPGRPQAGHRHRVDQPDEATHVIEIAVGDHDEIEAAHTSLGEQAPQSWCVGAAVDENGGSPRPPEQGRVSLADVEEGDRRLAGPRGRPGQGGHQRHGDQRAHQRPERSNVERGARDQRQRCPARSELGPGRSGPGEPQDPLGHHYPQSGQSSEPEHHARAAEGRRHRDEGRGEEVRHRRDQRHGADSREQQWENGRLGGQRRPQDRPHRPWPAAAEEARPGDHPGSRRDGELKTETRREVSGDQQQQGDGTAERRPRSHGDTDDPPPEEQCRHGRRTNHRGLPPGSDHEDDEGAEAGRGAYPRAEAERPEEDPPTRQEESHVSPGHCDEVGQAGAPQVRHLVVGEAGRVPDEKPRHERRGRRCPRLLECPAHPAPQHIARPQQQRLTVVDHRGHAGDLAGGHDAAHPAGGAPNPPGDADGPAHHGIDRLGRVRHDRRPMPWALAPAFADG